MTTTWPHFKDMPVSLVGGKRGKGLPETGRAPNAGESFEQWLMAVDGFVVNVDRPFEAGWADPPEYRVEGNVKGMRVTKEAEAVFATARAKRLSELPDVFNVDKLMPEMVKEYSKGGRFYDL